MSQTCKLALYIFHDLGIADAKLTRPKKVNLRFLQCMDTYLTIIHHKCLKRDVCEVLRTEIFTK